MGIKVTCILKNNGGWGCKMAWWVKALATKPDDLSSIPGTHRVEAENQLFPGTPGKVCMSVHVHTETHKVCHFFKKKNIMKTNLQFSDVTLQ